MATMAPAVSEGFCQPEPALITLLLAVPVGENVGAGSVGIVPVGVYEGSRVAAPALLIDVGGQRYEAKMEAGI
jgi:hypothetical protein